MRKTILFIALTTLVAFSHPLIAQQSEKFPLGKYTELTDTKPYDNAAVWATVGTKIAWGSSNERYAKLSVPRDVKTTTWRGDAWRGERVNAQAIVWSNEQLNGAQIEVSDLKKGKDLISASSITSNFIGYVMTDELNKDGRGGCGSRPDKSQWDSSIVADPLDIVRVRDIVARTTQPIWMNIAVPSDAKPGTYRGTLTVKSENMKPLVLRIELKVDNRILPEAKDWAFHLDLWQNPYAVARYNQVPLWSKEHFDALRPIMKKLASAGQKVITTSIMHKPWAGQTEDYFDNMIFRMKNIDGTWTFDYAVFDKWVEFMMNDVGISDHINCYTLIPWALKFDYFDQATNRVLFVNSKPGEAAYADYWGSFLSDFSKHLRAKGWFEKTSIAMDERPQEAMKAAIKLIHKADPEFKISLAGHYHGAIQADLDNLSLAYGKSFPSDVLKERRAAGKISTVYTCCAEARPNMFTFSPVAETPWTMWHAVAGDYDGYLRWAFNSWTIDPLRDSRFRTWAAGDTYVVYPGFRSSIRMEKIIEGVQDAEKIRILREEFEAAGDTKNLTKLNDMVKKFTQEGLAETNQSMTDMLIEGQKLLNSF